MGSKNYCFEIPPKTPERRVTVDERRSGNVGRDGYAVLDQAMKPDRWGYKSKERRGVGATDDDYPAPAISFYD